MYQTLRIVAGLGYSAGCKHASSGNRGTMPEACDPDRGQGLETDQWNLHRDQSGGHLQNIEKAMALPNTAAIMWTRKNEMA